MHVAVGEVGVLHQSQTGAILICGRKGEIVVGKHAAIFECAGNHGSVDVAEVLRVVLVEHGTEVALAEVAGVLEHDVENQLHAALVHFVNQLLESVFGILGGSCF